MQIDLYELFSGSPTLVLFVVVGLGYLLGRTAIRGFELGATGGVLLIALAFGHAGFEPDPLIGTIGFTMFIYAVGVQAGPRFFSVMLENGPKYLALACVVGGTAVVTAKLLALAFGLDNGLTAGILAGALTSTPTLVGAQSAVETGVAIIPVGQSPDDVFSNITVGYAITYVFGMVGLILIIKLLPGILKLDLVASARSYAREKGFDESRLKTGGDLPVVRGYEVTGEELVGKTVEEASAVIGAGQGAIRIKRGRDLLTLDDVDTVQMGDRFSALATPGRHAELRELEYLTPGILDPELLDAQIDTIELVVMSDSVAGHRLDELQATRDFRAFVTRIRRNQIDMPVADETVLQRGDTLMVVGEAEWLERLAERVGVIESDVIETDLLTFAGGIALGVLIGQIQIKIGAVSVGLGSAGGLLLTGILVGYLSSLRPTFGRVPPAARYITMELGLLFFMVGIGMTAGAGIVEALVSVGPVVIFSGIVVLLVPVVVGYLFGHYVLKLNPALLLGSITGAMTSTPALGAVQDAAKSSIPALGYAGTYAIANILLALAGTLIMIF